MFSDASKTHSHHARQDTSHPSVVRVTDFQAINSIRTVVAGKLNVPTGTISEQKKWFSIASMKAASGRREEFYDPAREEDISTRNKKRFERAIDVGALKNRRRLRRKKPCGP